MTEHESKIVKRTLSYASQEVRAAQRCVEVLANLFEDMRRELYPPQASRIWSLLNHIPNLERVPMYPTEVLKQSDKGWCDDRNVRYRWHFVEHVMPMFNMRSLADEMDELSELLSGVKIEDVAQSRGMESYQQYMRSEVLPIPNPPREPFKNPAIEKMLNPKE
jgi:hypothetical protein